MKPRTAIFGLMAEFETADAVVAATTRAYQAGYRAMDAHSPYTVEGLATALGIRRSRVPSIVLIAGLIGGGVGFFMQWWTMAVNYPMDVGGRPLNSWPAFIPVTFEVLVLVASFAAFFGMLFLNGLPRPNHPVFAEPRFARASQDRFFLCIEAIDPKFDSVQTTEFLAGLQPLGEIMVIAH
jgi:hypothetical protein